MRFSVDGIAGVLVTPAGEASFRSPMLGRFNLYNILAAAGTGTALDVPLAAIVRGIEGHRRVPGRLERVDNDRGITLLVDYAHTGDALENVLQTLKEIATARIITVFGCGGDRDPGKRPVMGKIAATLSDLAIVTSDNPRTEDPSAIMAQVKDGHPPARPAGSTGRRSCRRHWMHRDSSCAKIGGKPSAWRRGWPGRVTSSCWRGRDTRTTRSSAPSSTTSTIGKRGLRLSGQVDKSGEETKGYAFGKGQPMFTIEEIARATGGKVIGSSAGEVTGVSTDSRTVKPGQLFVPLRGERFDGHAFIAQAAARGVRACIADTVWCAGNPAPAGVTVVVVNDTLRGLGDLASFHRCRFSLPVIGVTGSNGKTTTKEMLASILDRTGPGLKTAGNLNNLIGLPLMLLLSHR